MEELGKFDPLRGPKFNLPYFQPATALITLPPTRKKEQSQLSTSFRRVYR